MQLDAERSVTGTIFNIQRYSIHDGPGIRTVVFLKGCPLRCLWCSNPESQLPGPELMVFEERCTRCLRCVAACPNGARCQEDGKLIFDRSRCQACGKCVSACPNGVLKVVGAPMTPEDVVGAVEQDRAFYDESGGGVTLSGGEPAFQSHFAAEILRRCQERYIHTVVETTGYAPWDDLWRVLEPADLVLYDLKHPYPTQHYEFTRRSNDIILENARRVSAFGKEMVIRIPLIPGVNDGAQVLEDICKFMHELGSVTRVDILPYHEFGRHKYRQLGREYLLGHLGGVDPDSEAVIRASEAIERAGFRVQVGG